MKLEVAAIGMALAAIGALAAMPKTELKKPVKMLMIAHRGAGDLRMPEASRPAYSNAVATACDVVKLDLQETKDGVIVMGHDGTLKRNMGWDVRILDVTYAEILEKGRFTPKGGVVNERIVRLDEALAIVGDIPEFWIDFNHFTPAFAEKVLATFKQMGIAEGRLMVATYTKAAIAYFQQAHPNIRRVGHISGQQGEKLYAYCKKFGLWGVNMPVRDKKTSKEAIRELKKRNLWVSLYFVQDRATAEFYRDSDADAYVTDHVSDVR